MSHAPAGHNDDQRIPTALCSAGGGKRGGDRRCDSRTGGDAGGGRRGNGRTDAFSRPLAGGGAGADGGSRSRACALHRRGGDGAA
uniref:Uncharacterized protein n=1 Tax=Caldilinea aerophila TaxID=133453 RepID=A0A7C1JK75_9CHLR